MQLFNKPPQIQGWKQQQSFILLTNVLFGQGSVRAAHFRSMQRSMFMCLVVDGGSLLGPQLGLSAETPKCGCPGTCLLPCTVVAVFQEWAIRERGHGSCQFLNAWAQKLVYCYLSYILLVKMSQVQGEGINTPSIDEENQRLWDRVSKRP